MHLNKPHAKLIEPKVMAKMHEQYNLVYFKDIICWSHSSLLIIAKSHTKWCYFFFLFSLSSSHFDCELWWILEIKLYVAMMKFALNWINRENEPGLKSTRSTSNNKFIIDSVKYE